MSRCCTLFVKFLRLAKPNQKKTTTIFVLLLFRFFSFFVFFFLFFVCFSSQIGNLSLKTKTKTQKFYLCKYRFVNHTLDKYCLNLLFFFALKIRKKKLRIQNECSELSIERYSKPMHSQSFSLAKYVWIRLIDKFYIVSCSVFSFLHFMLSGVRLCECLVFVFPMKPLWYQFFFVYFTFVWKKYR